MGSVTACFARVAKTLSPEDREAILKPIRDEITGRISAASKADPNADANAVALEVLDGMLSGATAPSPADGASATPTKEKPDAGDVGARSQAGQDAAATPGDGRQRQGGQDDAQAQDGLKAKPRTLREAQERRAAALHQDPGEKPEAATPAVVAESLQKAAKREQVSPEAVKEAVARGWRVPDKVLYDYPTALRSDLSDDDKDLASDAMVTTYQQTKDYGKAVQAYRDWKPGVDLKGFERTQKTRDGFVIEDGDITILVSKTKTWDGKERFQARLKNSTTSSSPNLTEQQAIDWADVLRQDMRKAAPAPSPAPAAQPKEPAHFAELRERAAAYWDGTVVPAVREYLNAYDAMGAAMMERNRIKPEGMSAREWLESWQRRKSEWDGSRKTQTTGIQGLSQKDLWPTTDGRGERLRKAMLAAIKALNGAPMTNSEMMDRAFGLEAEAASQSNPPAPTAEGREVSQQEAEQPGSRKIEDFGEKLEGARKDFAAKMKDAMELDVKTVPLSESWPEPNYEKLLAGGADPFVVGWVRASRDEIPTKPQQAWKLQQWVKQVILMRDVSQKMLNGDISADKIKDRLAVEFASLRDAVGGRAEMYERLGHEQSLKGLRVAMGQYSMLNGVTYDPPKIIWSVERSAKGGVFGNWPRQIVTSDTRQGAIDAFVDKVKADRTTLEQAGRATTFDIWRENGKYHVGKKIGRQYASFKRFDSVKEARDYKANNQAELEAALERYKTVPFERKAENAPRVGADHRGGAKVTPEVFADTFGFRGVQFGNYVEDNKRQADLNDAYDALMDLAAVLGIPPRALSLNGQLGLAFGARGKGGKNAAAAHYERDKTVINLTKESGAGSLAHEWFHATDNYFGKMGGAPAENMMTGGARNDAVRTEMAAAFRKINEAIRSTGMRARARALDERRTKEYWSTPVEMSARAFEAYAIAKLADNNAANDYLANVVSPQVWKAQEALSGREDGDTYPYPTEKEMGAIREAFDGFFRAVETRTDEAGNVAMFSLAGEQAPNLRVDATELAPDTAQAYATASDADQRAVRRLQTSMARYIPGLRLDAVAAAGGREAGQPLQGADRARVAAAELLRALTGRRAVFFRSSGGPVVNGVHSSLAPDVLFLRHDATRPHMAVLGHEFLHGLRQDRPDLYDVLRDRMRLVSTRKHEPGADLQEKRRKLGLAPLSADALEEEFLADVMGDSWMDASFWKSLAGKEPNTLLRRAFTAAMRFVDDVLRKIADLNPFGTNAYLSDIKAARAAMAQALRDYVEVESVGAPAVDLNFSAGGDAPWYSALAREIGAARMNVAGPAAWQQIIDGMVKAGKVKADEVEWSGVREWLGLQQGKVTREAVSGYLRDNGVRVQEKVLGGLSQDESTAMERRRLEGLSDDALAAEYFEFNERDPYEDFGDDWRPEAVSSLLESTIDRDESDGNVGGTKYANYTLSGGTNYREVLLTLPTGGPSTINAMSDAELRALILRNDQNADVDGVARADLLQMISSMELSSGDLAKLTGKNAAQYKSRHWDQPNVLAHIRLNDRTDADGRRVLFVEEIQSDWGQAAKKDGFAKPLDASDLDAYQQADNSWNINRISDRSFVTNVRGFAGDPEGAIAEAARRMGGQTGGVPRAPFVDKTDKWVALAIKRIVKMAVDEGYDRVAFVTGEQSAERYDLSKQVKEITYEPTDRGYFLNVMTIDGRNALAKNLTREEVADTVGKDLLEKMERREGRDDGAKDPDLKGTYTLSGLDLKVGGEGMRAFYDKIVPSVLKDVLRKVGGGQLTDVGISGQGERAEAEPRQSVSAGGGWQVYAERDGETLAVFPTREKALEDIRSRNGRQQPGFDITGAMRERAAGGMPMFSMAQRQAQTDTPEFKRWFGDSKVVDAQGRPLVVYHGTGRDVEVFSSAAPTATDKGGWGRGFYFAADPGYAAVYARKGAAPNVMPVYVSLRNPIVVAADGEWSARANAIKALGLDVPRGDPRAEWATEFTEAAQAKGHDGVISTIGGRPAEVVAFRPEQIKSATGNNGQFDPGNPDIRFSLDGAVDTLQSNDTARRLSERVIDVLRSDSTIGLLGRTVGTPYHLAHAKRADGSLRNPDLRKVYDEAQDYLNDINTFANDPAELAPGVVPMLNKWSDARRPLRLAGEQRAKLARALFEGTLGWTRDDQGNAVQTDDPHKGIEWTGTELRQRFGFNDADVKLYQQTRAAIGRSLDLMAGAEVARQMGGRDLPEGLRAMVSRGDTGRFKGLVLGFLTQQVDAAESAVRTLKAEHREQLARFAEATPGPDTEAMRDALKARQAAALEQAEAKLGKWKSLQAGVQKTYERVEDLKDRGYMPLMRFGPHTVTVRDIDTKEVVFFGMYETQAEANVEARKLRETAAPNEAVSRGEMSQEQWRLFKGMSPETVELFGQVAGIERTPVFEEYIRRTKANHSALKRLIQRKGTPGFSEDVQRVLAAFLTSNARAAAANLHAGAMEEATLDIDQERGLIKDYATKLTQYVQNPTDEAQWLRGLMFVQFIGGSVASAVVNMTQPFTMTLPWLSQHGGPVGAARLLTSGMRAALTRIAPDSDLGKAMARAEKDGIVSPQALHELQGQAVNRFGRTESALRAMGVSTKAAEVIDASLRRVLFAWGGFFSLAEQFNRRATFIAAYQLAQEKGMADAFAFAEEAVTETQGQYSRANRPQWARGPVMSTVFTFKQFSIAYIEFLARLPRREKAIAMAVLLVAAGLEGLPFADDLDDLIDTIAQRIFGKAFSAKRAKVELLSEVLGRDGAEWVLRGASALPGFPVDLAGRMSLGNMIPGTGLLRTDGSRDKSSEVLEALGPAGGVLRDAIGEGSLVERFAPVAMRNAAKALEMNRTGEYRDKLGRKVADVDGADAVAKGFGFQPREIARESRDSRMAQSVVAQTRAEESEIVRLWAQGIVDGEPDKVTQAQEQLAAWNQRNPDARIAINRVQIARMARDMRATREDRVIRAAPKELRGRVAEELR